MKITDIKAQKRYRNRVSIYIDGKYRFSLDSDTLNRACLHIGENIEEKEVETLTLRDEFARARDYGFLLLSYRDRSEYELKKRLYEKEFHSGVVREVLEYFKQEKLVDDRTFVRKWIENTLDTRPMGRMRVTHELKKKMIRGDIIEEAVQDLCTMETEERLARKAASKKMKALGSYPAETAKKRLFRFLRSRGFPFNLIDQLMKEYFSDNIR